MKYFMRILKLSPYNLFSMRCWIIIMFWSSVFAISQSKFSLRRNYFDSSNWCMFNTCRPVHILIMHSHFCYLIAQNQNFSFNPSEKLNFITKLLNPSATLFFTYNIMASVSKVNKLAFQMEKNLSVSQKTTKHVNLQGKKKNGQSFCLIGQLCREDVEVSRGALRYQLRALWGTDHDVTIINTSRRNVFIFRIQNRAMFQRIVAGRPHSPGGYLLALMSWDFGMNINNVQFKYEIFNMEFRVRSDLDRDDIPYMVASEAGEVISLFNRDNTGVVKAKVKVDINLPLCRKVRMTLEDGERLKFALFYLGFPSATCRNCYVLNHTQQYCGLVHNLAWLNVPILNLQGADPLHGHVIEENEMEDIQIQGVVDVLENPINVADSNQVGEGGADMQVDEVQMGDAAVNVELPSLASALRINTAHLEVAVERDPPNSPVEREVFVSDLDGDSSSQRRNKRPRFSMDEDSGVGVLASQIITALNKLADAVNEDENSGASNMGELVLEDHVAVAEAGILEDITNQVAEGNAESGQEEHPVL